MKTWHIFGIALVCGAMLSLSACDDDSNSLGAGGGTAPVPSNTPSGGGQATATATKGAATATATKGAATATATSVSATVTATVAGATATATVAGATATATVGAPTATATGGESTPTPTATQVTGEATATPTTPGGEGLGLRLFSVVHDATAADTRSQFNSSGLGGLDVTTSWLAGKQMKIMAGAKDVNGVAPLTLTEDFITGAQLIAGQGSVCFELLAAGSSGSVDCNGTANYDLTCTLDSQETNPGLPEVCDFPTGTTASPAGSAVLIVMGASINISSTDPADCATATFGPASVRHYTTAMATSVILNPRQTSQPSISLSKTGEPLNCDAWTTDVGGKFVSPLEGEDAPIINQDVINMIQFAAPLAPTS